MGDKQLSVATYAAGASLAAITLVYIFGPTFFSYGDTSLSKAGRKKTVVGLYNPANDCFINACLQTLAGLSDLRAFLAREVELRALDANNVYSTLVPREHRINEGASVKTGARRHIPSWLQVERQAGTVTAALKQFLNSLSQAQSSQRTLSAGTFLIALEKAFRSGINRSQQDAHEFLQLVIERLGDEFEAGQQARRYAESQNMVVEDDSKMNTDKSEAIRSLGLDTLAITDDETSQSLLTNFPLQGKIESVIACSTCFFSPKPSISIFSILTLHVPQKSSNTTLDACLDGLFLTEHIDDFKCDRCRLQHAVQTKRKELRDHESPEQSRVRADISALEHAIVTDPEEPPRGVHLPDILLAPKRRISKSTRMASFPQTLALHLSRSVWADAGSTTSKNQARVAFSEILVLGGLAQRTRYRLLAVITHQGAHHSGHYESLRRQDVQTQSLAEDSATSPVALSPDVDSKADSADASKDGKVTTAENESIEKVQSTDVSARLRDTMAQRIAKRAQSRKKMQHDRWWRISDDKVRECDTKAVLAMQSEVYMLFYERLPEDR